MICYTLINLLSQSLKSRGYVSENFAWRHYYWFLTNEGKEDLCVVMTARVPFSFVTAALLAKFMNRLALRNFVFFHNMNQAILKYLEKQPPKKWIEIDFLVRNFFHLSHKYLGI